MATIAKMSVTKIVVVARVSNFDGQSSSFVEITRGMLGLGLKKVHLTLLYASCKVGLGIVIFAAVGEYCKTSIILWFLRKVGPERSK
jgi:hypothetical protein